MNGDEAVTKKHRNFVRRICSAFNPVSRILDGLLHVRRDAVGVDSYIANSRTIMPGPTPHVAKHPPVKLHQESTVEDISFTSLDPT
jgi:hypothetical protein